MYVPYYAESPMVSTPSTWPNPNCSKKSSDVNSSAPVVSGPGAPGPGASGQVLDKVNISDNNKGGKRKSKKMYIK